MDLNFDNIVSATKDRIKERDKRKQNKANPDIYSTGEGMIFPTKPEEFVVGPEWWQQMTGTLGIPYGFMIQVAGTTDSGKTSLAIEFLRKAQEQNVIPIWADTEGKTTRLRLTQWGADPDRMLLLKPKTLEEMYEGFDEYLETVDTMYGKDAKLLFIIDSLGNTVSETEAEVSIRDSVQMGKRANINNRGFSRIASRMRMRGNMSVLIVNQTYDNMGSPGKQNKGGKNKDFYSALIFQTSRIGWIEGTVKGEKVRKGAKVKYSVYKNHLIDNDQIYGKAYELDITAKGIALKGEVPEEFKKITPEQEIVIDEETGEILE